MIHAHGFSLSSSLKEACIRSDDMYKSIALAGKLAADQMSEKHHMNEAKQRRRGKSHRPQVEVDEL